MQAKPQWMIGAPLGVMSYDNPWMQLPPFTQLTATINSAGLASRCLKKNNMKTWHQVGIQPGEGV